MAIEVEAKSAKDFKTQQGLTLSCSFRFPFYILHAMPVQLQMCDHDTHRHPSAKQRSANREVRTSAGLLKPGTQGGYELVEME